MGAALDQIISLGLILILIFTALAFGTVEPWSVAVFELSTLILLVLWVIKAVVEDRLTLLIPPVTWPLLALFVLGLAQSFAINGADGRSRSLSLDVEATRMATMTLFYVIIALLLLTNFLARLEHVAKLGHFLVFYGLLFSLFGLAQHFSWNGKFFWLVEPTYPLTAPFGSFVNHSHFAGYIEMMMPFPLALILFRCIGNEARLFYGFAVVVMGMAVIISLSRGGMISMCSGLFFVLAGSLFVLRKRRGRWWSSAPTSAFALASRVGVGVLVPVLIIGGIFWVGADPVIDRMASSHLTGDEEQPGETFHSSRGFIWKDTLKMIAAHPLTGVGLGAYATVYPKYSGHDTTALPVAQAHNDYLQILADGGVVGSLLALWFIGLIGRSFFQAMRHPDPMLAALALGAGGGIFALLVHSIFDFNLQLPSNALMFLLLAAIVSVIGVAAGRLKKSATNAPSALRVENKVLPLITRR